MTRTGSPRVIRNDSLLMMLALFYLAGLRLAFTPCVLPMVPILSGIIVGGGQQQTTGRAFMLSLTYVLGMALTYTAAGVAAAAVGKQVQALFQQWWVLALFAALFVAMALSMFGLFTVQMPAAIQTRIANVSNRQTAGTFGGVAIMGALSALIVTTCVGPALVGALLVISQTGQIARGGAALFAMSIGMGTPLLVVGASAGRLLPKAGPWMDLVKKLFGVMMLAVAAWMLARIVPERLTLLLWAVPALILAWLLWTDDAAALAGGSGPARPRRGRRRSTAWRSPPAQRSAAPIRWRRYRPSPPRPTSCRSGRSARWPTSTRGRGAGHARRGGACSSTSRRTGAPPARKWSATPSPTRTVQQALRGTVLLRANVTENNADDQALLKRFGIFGPPTIAFYGDGRPGALRSSGWSAT